MIGDGIRNFRVQRRITQEELAKMCEVTPSAVSSWERNRTEPSTEMMLKLSHIFNCDVTDLFDGERSSFNMENDNKQSFLTSPSNTENALTEEEQAFLDLYRQLKTIEKLDTYAYMKGFLKC